MHLDCISRHGKMHAFEMKNIAGDKRIFELLELVKRRAKTVPEEDLEYTAGVVDALLQSQNHVCQCGDR